MDEKTRFQLLDNIGKRNMPDTVDVTSSVMAQIQQKRKPIMPLYRRPTRLIATIIMSLLCVATTVYAVAQLQIHDPALTESMVTELDLSQTIDDTTVTVNWAYADANRIVISYTMSKEDQELPNRLVSEVQLTDSEGRIYKPGNAFGIDDMDVPEMLTGNAHFDASIIDDEQETLDLHLKILYQFEFDFTVPFISGIRIEEQPSVEAAGLNANIEWAVITPSMTRVYFCYDKPTDDLEFWAPNVKLYFDGERVAYEIGANYPDFDGIQNVDGQYCRGNIFLTRYDSLPEEITLSITSLQTATFYDEEAMQEVAERLAEHGIYAEVIQNPAQTRETYMLNFPDGLGDMDDLAREQLWEEIMADIEPEEGKRIDGPWNMTAKLP